MNTIDVSASIIDHHQEPLAKYTREIDQLPQHTARIPTQHELQLGKLKIQVLELKYIMLENKLMEIQEKLDLG